MVGLVGGLESQAAGQQDGFHVERGFARQFHLESQGRVESLLHVVGGQVAGLLVPIQGIGDPEVKKGGGRENPPLGPPTLDKVLHALAVIRGNHETNDDTRVNADR